MPREGVLGQATRIDPVPADHEALDSLRTREDLGTGELVLRTADGTEISLPSSLLRLVVSAANNLAAGRAEGRSRIADIAAAADLPYLLSYS